MSDLKKLADALASPRRWHELTDADCDAAAAALRVLVGGGSPLGRDADWSLAIAKALDGKATHVPITPNPDEFRKLFASVAAAQRVPERWECAEEWEPLAWQLCADENGEDACTELVWEGGPIPEPWGDRWLKYEGEAKRMIKLVRKYAAPPAPAAEPAASSNADLLPEREGQPDTLTMDMPWEHERGHWYSPAAVRRMLAAPAAEPAERTPNRNEGHGHVYPRPDGIRMRCGGPAVCSACALDKARADQARKGGE